MEICTERWGTATFSWGAMVRTLFSAPQEKTWYPEARIMTFWMDSMPMIPLPEMGEMMCLPEARATINCQAVRETIISAVTPPFPFTGQPILSW